MSGREPLHGVCVNSKDVCRSLRRAAEAAHVHAVVLRVDSPGDLVGSHKMSNSSLQLLICTCAVVPVV